MKQKQTEKKLAYLASEYPALSHTFIYREVQGLRAEGWKVKPASINATKNLQKFSSVEREEVDATFRIKSRSKVKILKDLVQMSLANPAAIFAMIREAVSLYRKEEGTAFKLFFYFVEAVVLLAWMQRENVDHIHVHFANPAATVALIAAATGLITFSLSVHGPDEFYNIKSNAVESKFKAAKFIRAISYFCKSQIIRLLPPEEWDKVTIVHCGVNPDHFAPVSYRKNETLKVLCVGRLCHAKAQPLLIEACHELKQQGVDFKLILVGGGETFDSIKQSIEKLGLQEKVTLTGALGQDQVKEYYREANVFVLPSVAEGVPVVLMEAMAMEIPVISTRIMGIPELIDHGKNGFLVTPADSRALAHSIIECGKNPRLEDIRKAGRKTVIQEFNIENSVSEMANLFQNNLHAEKNS